MNDRLKSLDSIRIVCAVCVAINHIGWFSQQFLARMPRVFTAGSGVLINGPAAVIAFFVISGFCIHFPFRRGGAPFLPEYFCRRFIRIGLPMAVAMFLVHRFHSDVPAWSLYAELVYYALYPLLLWGARRVGWKPIIAVAFVLSSLVVATNPFAENYPSYDYWNWLLGLPCWLVGCAMAENLDRPRVVSRIWLWRATVWAASVVAMVLRFHSPIGYPFTLNLFSLLVAAWLVRELVYWRDREPVRWLEWAGRFSYALYLVHFLGGSLPARLGWVNGIGDPTDMHLALRWLCILVTTAAFYYAVELPSQKLAKWAGNRTRRLRRAPDAAATQRAA